MTVQGQLSYFRQELSMHFLQAQEKKKSYIPSTKQYKIKSEWLCFSCKIHYSSSGFFFLSDFAGF